MWRWNSGGNEWKLWIISFFSDYFQLECFHRPDYNLYLFTFDPGWPDLAATCFGFSFLLSGLDPTSLRSLLPHLLSAPLAQPLNPCFGQHCFQRHPRAVSRLVGVITLSKSKLIYNCSLSYLPSFLESITILGV